LRDFADQLLRARSAAGVFRALAQTCTALKLELLCIAPADARVRAGGRPSTLGLATAAQRRLLGRLHPLNTHPLFCETLAEVGAIRGNEIRKRRGLSRAAWDALTPREFCGRETLSLVVRGGEHGRTGGDWFVLMTLRGNVSGLACSVILVASHLARDRYDALVQEKAGRATAANRANEALQLMVRGTMHIGTAGLRPPAKRRRASNGDLH
jgi:hypothetical protein